MELARPPANGLLCCQLVLLSFLMTTFCFIGCAYVDVDVDVHCTGESFSLLTHPKYLFPSDKLTYNVQKICNFSLEENPKDDVDFDN